MAVDMVRRIVSLLFFAHLVFAQKSYEIPEVRIQAFEPEGFRASIPDAPNLTLFAFQGNINRAIGSKDVGALSGEVLRPTNGKWVFEDPNVKLKVGDIINYYIFVSVNRAGYIKDKLSYTITQLENRNAQTPATVHTTPPPVCQPSVTKIRGGVACAGQTIFEDNFDSLREDLWQIEQYIPLDSPEYPFLSYQRLASDPTVSILNGHLYIKPKLQINVPGFNKDSLYSGTLNLFDGCTGSSGACFIDNSYIVPPVVSGRVTSKAFSFTYGTVHVRAKLPQGDWLYPEILLEPFIKKYGAMRYASGVIKIATARGNKELNGGTTDYGNKILYGGPIMDYKCREQLLTNKVLDNGRMWGDDFHIYSVVWTPDRITLLVDGEEYARVEPSAGGLRGRFSKQCELPRRLLAMGSSMAPFDDHFYVTLGMAVGGITEFRDGLYTGSGWPKPWTNNGRKASLNFWQAKDSWLPTWSQPELIVDYVRVVAL